ncbi:discoidin domain-containing protein [Cytobacillus oceanisediminis]|uniref:discoidin domain-containing protein n=1 Tax=Cytobacillus oceanisediminis TaxID=665099 RepID=UPI001FB35094|nr:discoidin domain-containing protein [Cytobacillus oceanisediminis]UOE58060.1 discoidin domain-containing protein [Cytobacillus oceanisediminis]
MPKANGQITILDINDAFVSGTPPKNPTEGVLWIDDSVSPSKLYSWSNGTWVEQTLSIAALDPGFYDEVQDLKDFARNSADDGLISNNEKLNIKLLLVEITGDTLTDSTLPTLAEADGIKGGQVYMVRAEAKASGVPTNHVDYIAFETAYKDLKAYVESLSPKLWEPGDTAIDTAVWPLFWDAYFEALSKLQVTTSTYLADSIKPGESYNGVTLTEQNGVVVLRGDNLFKAILNATEGLSISKNVNGTWHKVFYTNTDGKIYATGLEISSDSNIAGTPAGTVVENAETALKTATHVIAKSPAVTSLSYHQAWGTRMAVTEDIHLGRTKIYSSQAGTLVVDLYEFSTWQKVDSRTYSVVVGENTLTLDMLLRKEVAEYVLFQNSLLLHRHTSGAPFDSGSFKVLGGASSPTSTNPGYYYFYDIEIAGMGVDGILPSAVRYTDEVKSRVDDMMSDMKVTPLEKSTLSRDWEAIKAEYNQLILQANAWNVTKTDYQNAYSALNSTSPRIETDILSSLTTTYTFASTSARDTFKNQINAYFDQAEKLRKAINEKMQHDTKDYVVSRGENLVTNGSGMLGNNTNFSSFTFDSAEVYSGKGSFKTVLQNGTIFSDELIPVNPNDKYRMSLMYKGKGVGGNNYFGTVAYDIDGMVISPYHFYGSQYPIVELARDLKVGDTEVYLTSVDGFMDNSSTPDHRHSMVFWGYKNSFGYQYPDGTYSRDVFTIAWGVGAIDRTLKKITFNKAFNLSNPADPNGIFRTGHKVSATSSGGSYQYIAAGNVKAKAEWTLAEGWQSGFGMGANNFPHGTANIKLLFLTNRSTSGGVAGDNLWINNVSFTNIAMEENAKGYADTTYGPIKQNVEDMMSDLKVTPLEKSQLSRDWESIKAEYGQLSGQAAALNVSSTNYVNAYNALNSSTPRIEADILASMSTTYSFSSASARDTFKTQLNTYFSEAEKIRKAISDTINQKIDNVQVGGRNYYKKATNVSRLSGTVTITKDETATPHGFKLTGVTADSSIRISNVIDSNGYWTVSMKVKASAASNIRFDVADQYGANFNLTTEYQKISFTVNVTNFTSTVFNFIDIDSLDAVNYWFDEVKVEKGNIVTDFTTAPEDNEGLYTWVMYASDANGTGITSNPSGKDYIGFSYNHDTDVPSTNPADYTWSLVRGPQGQKGNDGTPGQHAVTGVLSNESHVLAANSSGTVSSYTGAVTTMSIYNGLTDDSANWTVTASPSNVTGTLSGKTYTVTALNADTGYVDLTASRSGYPSVTKRFALSKSKQGATGSSATSYWLVADVSAIQKSEAGDYTPNVINVTGKSQVGTGTPANYSGRFILAETTDGTTWTTKYTSSANEAVKSHTPSTGIKAVKLQLFLAGGTTTLLDEQIVPIVSDGIRGQNGTNGTNGIDGENAIIGVLTNESHNLPANSSGTVSTYAGAASTLTIYNGATDDTANWTITQTLSNATVTASGTPANRTATVTAVSADVATVTFTASRSGYSSITKTFTLTKSKQGATGSSATSYWLISDASAIQKNKAGVYTPASIDLTGRTQVGSGTPANYSGRFIIAESTDGTTFTDKYTSAANEATKSHTPSAGIKSIRVRMYLAGGTTTLLDEQIIPIVSDGADGQDGSNGTNGSNGQNAIIGVLSNEAAVLSANSSGTVSSYAGINTKLTIYNGSSDDTANWTITATVSNVSGSLSGSTYTVTGFTADNGYVDLTASRSGYSSITKRFVLSKSKQGSTGSTGARGPESDEALLMNINPNFYDWSSTSPNGYTLAYTAPTKVTSGNGTGNAAKWVMAAGGQGYYTQTIRNRPYFQYVYVESTFMLESGTLDGSGVLFRVDGTSYVDYKMHYKDMVPSPTLSKWYTVSKIFKMASDTPIAGFIGYSVFPMAAWGGFATVTAKTIQIDSVKVRPATDSEIYGYETGSVLDDWKGNAVGGKVRMNGGMIEANTIFAQQIAIGDFTNMAQIDAESNPNGFTTTDISNLKYFKVGQSAYSKITIVQAKTQEFTVGDEYYFAGKGYKESAIGSITAIIRYQYTDGTYTNAGSSSVPVSTSNTSFSANVKITADVDPAKTLNFVDFFFEKDNSTTGYFYIRSLEVRKRYSGNLLVDGTIQASHIKSLNGLNAAGGNFVIDSNGNVSMRGNITMSGGSITWGGSGVAAPTAAQVGARGSTWVPSYGEVSGTKPPTNATNTWSELTTNTNINGMFWTNAGKLEINADKITTGTFSAERIMVGSGTTKDGNLAIGATVSGTSTSTAGIDGARNVGSSYVTFGSGNSTDSNTEGSYYQLDLGAVYRIEQSRLFFFAGDDRYYWYKIKYSSDGTNWYYAVGNPENTGWKKSISRVATGNNNFVPTIDNFAIPITARYVRLFANGNSVNTSNHLYEWELYSATQTAIDGNSITTGTIDASKATITNLNASNIVTGTLDGSKATITNINASNIITGTLDGSKATITNINATNINTGTLDGTKATITNINASNIITGTLDASRATITNINATNISTGTLNVGRLASGSITVDKLSISSNPNMVRRGYDSFEQIPLGAIAFNSASTTTIKEISNAYSYDGDRSLKVQGTGTDNHVYLGTSSTDYHIPIIAGTKYIISFYAFNPSATAVSVHGYARTNDASATFHDTGKKSITSSSGWTRFLKLFTAPTGSTKALIRVDVDTANLPVYFDAFQFEEVDSGTEPSPFSPASLTTIDGGNINATYLSAISSNLGTVTAGSLTGVTIKSEESTGYTLMEGGKLVSYNKGFVKGSIQTFHLTTELDWGKLRTYNAVPGGTNWTNETSITENGISYQAAGGTAGSWSIYGEGSGSPLKITGRNGVEIRTGILGEINDILLDNSNLVLNKGNVKIPYLGNLQLPTPLGNTGHIGISNSSGREAMEIRVTGTSATGAGISLYGDADPTIPGECLIYTGGSTTARFRMSGNMYLQGLIENENMKSLSLFNGWVNYSSQYQGAAYWKDKNGVVYVTGLIKSGSITAGTIIGSLPAGYRPGNREIFSTFSSNASVPTRIDVIEDGSITIQAGGSASFTSLAAICFKAIN